MFQIKGAVCRTIACCAFLSLLVLVGCEGSETRGNIDDTVEKFSGKEQIEQMEKIKKDVQESMDKQAERLKDIE